MRKEIIYGSGVWNKKTKNKGYSITETLIKQLQRNRQELLKFRFMSEPLRLVDKWSHKSSSQPRAICVLIGRGVFVRTIGRLATNHSDQERLSNGPVTLSPYLLKSNSVRNVITEYRSRVKVRNYLHFD